MINLKLYKRGNFVMNRIKTFFTELEKWSYSFQVKGIGTYIKGTPMNDFTSMSITTHISKGGYETKGKAFEAGLLHMAQYFKTTPVTKDDINNELLMGLERGLYTIDELNEHIDFMVKAAYNDMEEDMEEDNADNHDIIFFNPVGNIKDYENNKENIGAEDIDLPQEYYEQTSWQERTDKPIDYKEEDDIY